MSFRSLFPLFGGGEGEKKPFTLEVSTSATYTHISVHPPVNDPHPFSRELRIHSFIRLMITTVVESSSTALEKLIFNIYKNCKVSSKND